MQSNYRRNFRRIEQSSISYRADRLLSKEVDVDLDAQEFSNRLKTMRKIRGLSQVELSEKIGMKQNQYSRYENGTIPERDILVKLCNALECSIDYLLSFADKPNEYRQYESLPNDEQGLVQVYRSHKLGDRISRDEMKMLRNVNAIKDENQPLVEGPKQADASSE